MTESVRKLKALVEGTDNIVFFGGAGVSTERSEERRVGKECEPRC